MVRKTFPSLACLFTLISVFTTQPTYAIQDQQHALVSPGCGGPGTLFELQWNGFTPNSTLTSHLRDPNGEELPIRQFNTDNNGTASFFLDSNRFKNGLYQHWAVDDATSGMSNIVDINLVPLPPNVDAVTFGLDEMFDLDRESFRTFLFCASAGDVIVGRLIGTTRYLALSLNEAGGRRLAFNSDFPARINVSLLTSGVFEVVAFNTRTRAESFSLNVQRVNNPGLARELFCNDPLLVSLNTFERHTYVFKGNAGDRVTIAMNVNSGNIEPFLEFYDSDGMPVVAPGDVVSNVRLRKTGRYTVIASSTGDAAGFYTITLGCQ